VESGSELYDALSSSFFSKKNNLVYVATPKVSCTSLKWWFAALEGVSESVLQYSDTNESDDDLKIHDAIRKILPESRLKVNNFYNHINSDEVFSFAVVRNPFVRVFSAWQSKILLQEPLQFCKYGDLPFANEQILSVDSLVLSFENFLLYLKNNELPDSWDMHWKEQWRILRPDLVPYGLVSKIENTDALKERLQQHLGDRYVDPFAGKLRNESVIPYSRAYLSDTAVGLICEMYAGDFGRFGYSLVPPAGSRRLAEEEFAVAARAVGLVRSRHARLVRQRSVLGEKLHEVVVQLGRNGESVAARAVAPGGAREVDYGALDDALQFILDAVQLQRRELDGLRSAVVERQEVIFRLEAELVKNVARGAGATARPAVSCGTDKGVSVVAAGERTFSFRDLLNGGKLHAKHFVFEGILALKRCLGRLPGMSDDRTFRICRTVYRALPLPAMLKRRLGDRFLMSCPDMMDAALGVCSDSSVASVAVVDQGGQSLASRIHEYEAAGLTGHGPRALVIEHRLPTPDRTSSSLRLDAIVHAMLERGWRVTFVSHSMPPDYHWVLNDVSLDLQYYEKRLIDSGVEIIYGITDALKMISENGLSFSYVFLSLPDIAYRYSMFIRAYMPHALLVYDSVDLHYVRFMREAVLRGMDKPLVEKSEHYEKIENVNISTSDVVVAITNEEKELIQDKYKDVKVEVIPNIHEVRENAPAIEGRRGIVFIGHYLHRPNEDAVEYFVNDILPLVQKKMGGVDFYLLGSSLTERVKRLASRHVHAIGFVEQPEEWFERARVFVAPLRFGAGMKGKVGHSMACGLPVVTTTVGAEGMGLENGRSVLIADTPEIFADSIVKLCEDDELWRRISDSGMEHIRNNFSFRNAVSALERLESCRSEMVIS